MISNIAIFINREGAFAKTAATHHHMHSEDFQIKVMPSNSWLSAGHFIPLKHAGDFINKHDK